MASLLFELYPAITAVSWLVLLFLRYIILFNPAFPGHHRKTYFCVMTGLTFMPLSGLFLSVNGMSTAWIRSAGNWYLLAVWGMLALFPLKRKLDKLFSKDKN